MIVILGGLNIPSPSCECKKTILPYGWCNWALKEHPNGIKEIIYVKPYKIRTFE